MEKTKKCVHCGKIKPVTEFNKHQYSKDGLQSYCKECQHNYKYGSNKNKVRLILKDITDADLLQELKARGYSGNLTKSVNVSV